MTVARSEGHVQSSAVLEAVTDSDHTLDLPDGRRMGYAVFGEPQGHPVVYAHGFPASRVEAGIYDAAARRAGVAIIAPDRPGFGLSDFQADRRIVDWADDVAHLADALGLQRFSLLGGSGGCPFALVCAWRFRERLVRVATVAGLAPPVDRALVRDMSFAARIAFALARHAPGAFGVLYGGIGSVVARYPGVLFLLNPPSRADVAVIEDRAIRDLLRASTREAFRVGTAGALHELRLLSQPWGQEPKAMDVRVTVWHGEEDGIVPSGMGRDLAARMPSAELRLLRGEGHISLPVRHGEEILRDLLPSD